MDLAGLVGIIIVLAIIGFVLWLIETKIPMDGTIKLLIQVVIVVAVLLYMLTLVGIVPRFR
jgi:hypothetical protein